MKVLVTGSTGFLGRNLHPVLKSHYGEQNVFGVSSADFDLLSQDGVEDLFKMYSPDVVVHLAAYSGGIGANKNYPADFFYKNSLFVSLMFEAAARHKIKKLIYTMGGCSYPAKASSPISEEQIWQGYPQAESAGYSMAKKMGLVASTSYRQQYGLNSVVLIPGNMYGEYDNFREQESHVIPAMVRRYYEAKLRGDKNIVMWGDGTPTRDFVYVKDVARTIPWFIDHYNSSDPINISSGTSVSMRELAEIIKRQLNWEGSISWDASKPNGQLKKIFDVTRLRSLGLHCNTSLDEGLDKTIRWFSQHYSTRSDGIRV